ncbi:A/G-specific adenine glycosylase [Aquibaculum arenosum]|uniref:Adenine DNA glycosylase n=1 Tax=Aquibaculum arenosum TaxID=3032591 RepID=A0ABT5YQA0_9PROT|nr:A/G-specific adenine glycosylase [Fodinicurvata sp. CAU 1616]MDF2097155.1 A/G-specific adenine glycosylase [Fodinicurvata sp. CAU 1616]
MEESISTAHASSEAPQPDPAALRQRLLQWYDRHARRLPWRALPEEVADPYHVWLSEIMLQQTTVVAAAPYFEAFLARWPRVEELAAAPLDEVLTAWAGLGYYARARNLHKCAQSLVAEHGGRFPQEEAALQALPGIGAYTAAAIAAIAFDRPAAPVDGNWERVIARLFAIETPLPPAKAEIREAAATLVSPQRPGDFAQAMMDLGAILCLPGRPKCLLCPLAEDCAAYALNREKELPARTPKAAKPTRRGIAFWTIDAQGRLLLRRRPEKGLLGGMMEVPSTEWRGDHWSEAEALPQAPFPADWRALPGQVRHTFTHFHLELEVWAGRIESGASPPPGSLWAEPDELDKQALPSVMRKVISHALKRGG